MENPILKKRQEIQNNILKGFGTKESEDNVEKALQSNPFDSFNSDSYDDIEKARIQRQDGDMHPNGKWVWRSSAAGGKGDWRVAKKGDSSGSGGSSMGAKEDNKGIDGKISVNDLNVSVFERDRDNGILSDVKFNINRLEEKKQSGKRLSTEGMNKLNSLKDSLDEKILQSKVSTLKHEILSSKYELQNLGNKKLSKQGLDKKAIILKKIKDKEEKLSEVQAEIKKRKRSENKRDYSKISTSQLSQLATSGVASKEKKAYEEAKKLSDLPDNGRTSQQSVEAKKKRDNDLYDAEQKYREALINHLEGK